MIIELNNICKSFGDKQVLNNISLKAESGMALGLLGRNGAGKTTTIRIIMDVFPPDSGKVLFDAKTLKERKISLGYLPEERGMYPRKIILDQLVYLGELRGMTASAAKKATIHWLERMEMSEYLNKRLDTLSKGNQQKIQLAATLINNPEVIILDEPFSGLDPVNAEMLKDIVLEQIKEGKIIFFSSHQMSYVEEFCDNIAILNKGSIVLSGNLRQIKRSYDRTNILLSFDTPERTELAFKEIKASLSDIIAGIELKSTDIIIKLNKSEDRNSLLIGLVKLNFSPERFEVLEPTLQDIFVEKVGDNI
ncbi:MAG: transporter ATP-binding protein [Clostridia bacterium]|nr:transporter ATP-binding protein [Clostridia bacterium]